MHCIRSRWCGLVPSERWRGFPSRQLGCGGVAWPCPNNPVGSNGSQGNAHRLGSLQRFLKPATSHPWAGGTAFETRAQEACLGATRHAKQGCLTKARGGFRGAGADSEQVWSTGSRNRWVRRWLGEDSEHRSSDCRGLNAGEVLRGRCPTNVLRNVFPLHLLVFRTLLYASA